jgi:hypothetical protein
MASNEVTIPDDVADYLKRLIASARKTIASDPETIKAKEELGEGVTIGRWLDIALLCDVVEQDVLSKTESEPAEQEPAEKIDRAFLESNLPVLSDNAETAIRAFGEDWAARLAHDALVLLNQYDDVLRGIAMSLAAGGYNSDGLIDPKTADEKIRWGINHIVEIERIRASTHTDSKAPIDARSRFEAWCVQRWHGDRGAFGRNPDDYHVFPGEYKMGYLEFAYQAFKEATRLSSQVPQWLPIESAPKDKRVLVFNEYFGVYSSEYTEDGPFKGFPLGLTNIGLGKWYCVASMWMPLPAAPLPPNQKDEK